MKNTKIILGAALFLALLGYGLQTMAERGVASYYHDRFHGRKTASGERYDKEAFTCAHRRLPFGTWLRVTNLKNGLSCVVKVNDRGPYSKKFTIDLSKAAARQIGIIAAGHAAIDFTIVDGPDAVIVPYKLAEEEEPFDIELDFVPAPTLPEWIPDSIQQVGQQPSSKKHSKDKAESKHQP